MNESPSSENFEEEAEGSDVDEGAGEKAGIPDDLVEFAAENNLVGVMSAGEGTTEESLRILKADKDALAAWKRLIRK